MHCLHLLFAASFTAAPLLSSHAAPAADLIVNHAKIWTGRLQQPDQQSLAVLNGRIVAVGSDKDVLRWAGSATKIVDAKGLRIVPGFDDAHVHLMDGGSSLNSVQLNDAQSEKEFANRIGERARHVAAGEWIMGGNWDETKWTPSLLPTRQLIDSVANDVPVAVSRYDGHMMVVNSLVLKLAGITSDTKDPIGGEIVRDAHGEPTGALKDAAMNLIDKLTPPLTPAQRISILERAFQYAVSVGVTSMQDMSNGDAHEDYASLAALSELREQGRLKVRVYAAPSITGVDDFTKIGVRHAFGGPELRIGALKAYSDGSVGSRTAYFFDGYDDNPQYRGLLNEEMHAPLLAETRMIEADTAGLQVFTHAIGDAGISAVLDLYAKVQQQHGDRDRRWRIEHAQHMAEKDFDRFRDLHVIASVQPFHAIDDGRWVESRIGHDRSSRTYAFRSFLNHGVKLAIGTDWPIAPLNPMQTLYAATTRATLDGKNPNGWFPEQKLTLTEAMHAYTAGSAYSEFQEKEKGTLEVGKLADFVMLNADIFAIQPEKIRDTKVLETWINGELVYEAP